MIKKIFPLILLFTFFSNGVYSQRTPIPEFTKVSLITCDPGLALYGKFGHTAIRVQDTTQYIDWVFNYGIFDFNKPDFYSEFIKGHTDYILGVYPFSNFIVEYKRDKIGVYEQDLNLTKKETEILVYNLIQNALPEYREYRYNFAFDNCATQPRDQILKALSHQLVFKKSELSDSFRYLIQSHLKENPWASMGINLIFGMGADRIATNWETQFLPLNLMRQMSSAFVFDYKSNENIKLVSKERILVSPQDQNTIHTSWIIQPTFWFILFFIIGLFVSFYKKRTSLMSKLYDTSWMVFGALVGLLILYLMLFSEHPFVNNNLNLMWLSPLYLLSSVLIWKRKYRKTLFYLNLFFIISIFIFLILIMLQYQTVPFDVLPLITIILYRLSRRSYRIGKKLYSKTN